MVQVALMLRTMGPTQRALGSDGSVKRRMTVSRRFFRKPLFELIHPL